MANNVPYRDEFKNERDRTIWEVYDTLYMHGFQPKEIYRRLHYLTGYSADYMKQIMHRRTLIPIED